MSVKGGGVVPPKSVTFFLAKILSVKGGGTPLTDKIRKVVFEVLPNDSTHIVSHNHIDASFKGLGQERSQDRVEE